VKPTWSRNRCERQLLYEILGVEVEEYTAAVRQTTAGANESRRKLLCPRSTYRKYLIHKLRPAVPEFRMSDCPGTSALVASPCFSAADSSIPILPRLPDPAPMPDIPPGPDPVPMPDYPPGPDPTPEPRLPPPDPDPAPVPANDDRSVNRSGNSFARDQSRVGPNGSVDLALEIAKAFFEWIWFRLILRDDRWVAAPPPQSQQKRRPVWLSWISTVLGLPHSGH
jgi:hypothetical protein